MTIPLGPVETFLPQPTRTLNVALPLCGVAAVIATTGALMAALSTAAPLVRGATLEPAGAVAWQGTLQFETRDASSGAEIPCKLTFVGAGGTARPAFTRHDIGRAEGDGIISAYDRVMSTVGHGSVQVPHGRYDIYVSRGPEWDIAIHRDVVIGTVAARIASRLTQVIDTRGWISGDFHVHAAPSPDSSVPLEHRVIEFVSDGVEVLVSTDHNVVTDYQPTVAALGVGKLITTIMGDELTTNGWGHFGAFPLPRDLTAAGQGAVLVHGHSAKDIFGEVRKHARGALIDVHHPRLDGGIGYFSVGEFDPHADRAARRGFSFDFDAVEVLNGYQDPVRKSVDRTIDDWLGLLNHGHIVTATGNSDTHHLDFNIGGYPRNYVRVSDDHPAAITPAQIAGALRAHQSFFTTGPFVRLRAGRADIGDVAPARNGRAALQIEVDAAPWMSLDRVILYVDGKEARRWRVPAATTVARFQQTVDVTFPRDGYAVVRVDGDRLMAPVVGDDRTFGVRPLALTNPIFFDVDGNGRYDPAYPHGAH
jgi:hypothetical protein